MTSAASCAYGKKTRSSLTNPDWIIANWALSQCRIIRQPPGMLAGQLRRITNENNVTSDHRVGGSRPAGCRSSSGADLQAIYAPRKMTGKMNYLPKFCHFWSEPPFATLFADVLLDTSQLWLIAVGLKGYPSDEPQGFMVTSKVNGLRPLISNRLHC